MIRKLNINDKVAFTELVRLFFDERISREGFSFSEEEASKHFDYFISVPTVHGLVSEENEKITGVIVFTVSNMLFSNELLTQEIVWYVRKENRGDGIKLMKAMELMSDELGSKFIMVQGMNEDRANIIYMRYGFKPLQNVYIKRRE